MPMSFFVILMVSLKFDCSRGEERKVLGVGA